MAREKNFTVKKAEEKIAEIKKKYSDAMIGELDGLSVTYADWRFNIRTSNTEPLLRLNLEAKTKNLVSEKVEELTKIIES